MAVIGLKYPVYAKLTDGTTPSYASGAVIAKAISAKITIEGSDENILCADDAAAESDTSFKGGSVELGVDDLPETVYAALLGHTITEAGESTPSVLTAKDSDFAPYVGHGFYKTKVKGGVRSYLATWLTKVQFSEPDDEAQTKGKTVEFQTPTIKGNIMCDGTGAWKKQASFTTESDAVDWLKEMASIS